MQCFHAWGFLVLSQWNLPSLGRPQGSRVLAADSPACYLQIRAFKGTLFLL